MLSLRLFRETLFVVGSVESINQYFKKETFFVRLLNLSMAVVAMLFMHQHIVISRTAYQLKIFIQQVEGNVTKDLCVIMEDL